MNKFQGTHLQSKSCRYRKYGRHTWVKDEENYGHNLRCIVCGDRKNISNLKKRIYDENTGDFW